MKKQLYTCLLFLMNLTAFGQYADSLAEKQTLAEITTMGIATGLHVNRYPMLELGYFKHTTFEYPMTFGGAYTVEATFIDHFVMAPKINYWMNVSFINAGFSVPWYLDLKGNNSLKIRPEVGFGYHNFKINYAINLSITHKDMEYIGKHFVSVNYYIGLKAYNK